jgi:hypothetical protein
MEDLQ